MHRAPTQRHGGRGVSFAPLAQNDSDLAGPNEDVSQRWENWTATEDFRSRIHSIFRNAAPIVEDEEDDGLQHARARGDTAAYAPVNDLIPRTVVQEADIAELPGPPTEYYAPYPRAPSALSKLSDAQTETTYLGSTYSGVDPGDKYLKSGPTVSSVEIYKQSLASRPPKQPDYKPFALRRTFVCALFMTTVVMLALMVVAIRVLPDETESLTENLVSRNTSKVKARSLGAVPQGLGMPYRLQVRHNGTSSVATSTSDIKESSSSILSTSSALMTSTTTTTKEEPSRSEAKSEVASTATFLLSTTTTSSELFSIPTSSRDHTSLVTTTSLATQPQRPSEGGDTPSLTTVDQTTTSTSTAYTMTSKTTSDKGQSTNTGHSATENDSKPSGGEKTQTHTGGPQPIDSDPTTTINASTPPGNPTLTNDEPTSTISTAEQTQIQSSKSDTESSIITTQTIVPAVSTATTSTYQTTYSQGDQTPPLSMTAPTGDNGSSHSTLALPLSTCTVDVTQTYIQWFTIPVITVNLGSGIGRRSSATAAREMRPRAAVCDTTVTILHELTIVSTTALSTITVGSGGGQVDSTTTIVANPGGTVPTDLYPSSAIQTQTYPAETSILSTGTVVSTLTDGSEPTIGETVPLETTTLSATTLDQAGPSTSTAQVPNGSSQPGVSTSSQVSDVQPTNSQPISQPTGTDIQATTIQATDTQVSVSPPTNIQSTGTQVLGSQPVDTKSSPQPTDTTPTNTAQVSSSDGTTMIATEPTKPTTTIYPSESTAVGTHLSDSSIANERPPSSATVGSTMTTIVDGSTIINVVPTAITNSTTRADGSVRPESSTNLVTRPDATDFQDTHSLPATITQAFPTRQSDSIITAGTHDAPPTPYTTVFPVIESTTVVQTVVSTFTSSASETETDAAVLAAGAVFMTSVEVTSVIYATRLVTQQVNQGIMTVITTVLTDKYGHPTSTATQAMYRYTTVQTLRDSLGFPTATQTDILLVNPAVTTTTDANGKTVVKTFNRERMTTTLRNKDGVATNTQVLEITETPTVVTEFDSMGRATKTVTKMIPDGTSTSTSVSWVTTTNAPNASMQQTQYEPIPISSSGYFLGILLPTLLAIGLAIPLRILDQTVKLYQPFSAMTWPYGACTGDSLCLNTTGLWGLVSGVISPRNGNWLLTVTGLLVVANSALIALSTEALQIAVQKSGCTSSVDGTSSACPTTLSITAQPAKAATTLLCLMVLLLGISLWGLWRRQTGIKSGEPWSMYEISRIARNKEIVALVENLGSRDSSMTRKDAINSFGKRRFVLDYWQDKSGWKYGIKVSNDCGDFDSRKKMLQRHEKFMPFSTLSWTVRSLFLLLLLGLLLMVLLYHNTVGAFQNFMDRENFGGRFILAGIGVIVSFIWWTFFSCIAFLSPYRMYWRRKYTEKAIYLSPPSNPFHGFWRVISGQHRDIYMGAVAFTAITSELLPLFLANIPTRLNDSDSISIVCVWLAVSIICIMIVVLVWSFLVTWPPMPIDPSTIAGAMFYAMYVSNFGDMKSSSSIDGRTSHV